jgi:threonine dehydrogenase-like Zn-dependent dehydrogenase
MKAAFFRSPGKVQLRELPVPDPGLGEALVRVARSGICGSDVAAFRSGRAPWHRRGHEFSGFVEKAGPGCSLAPGTLVAGIGSIPCGKCRNCLDGKPRLCEGAIGCEHDAFAEFVCKPEQFFFPCPSLTPDEASFMEPLTVAMDLVADAGVGQGRTGCIIGAGPIGLMALALCLAAGAARVYVSHPSAGLARRRVARKLEAAAVISPDKEDLPSVVLAREQKGVDFVLITAKPSGVIADAVRMAALGATIAFVGMEWKANAGLRFDVDRFHFRKQRLVGSNHNPCGPLYPRAAKVLRAKTVDAAALISHRFALARIAQAFEKAASSRASVVKVIVECSQGARP